MTPFLGQGANQAIQDAHMLALALSRVGTPHLPTVEHALHRYESVFRAPVRTIMWKSRLLGKLMLQHGFFGALLRKSVLYFVRVTGLLEHDLITAFLPRFE